MPKTQRFPGFPDGLNNVRREDQVPSTALRKAENIDLVQEGRVSRRRGYTQAYAGTDMHSLHATKNFLLGAEGTTLKLWQNLAEPPTTIATDVAGPIGYAEVPEGVVWSGEQKMGLITPELESKNFGLQAPLGQPALSVLSDGSLYEGYYQVAITYEDADGFETGTGRAAMISVPAYSNIMLSNIPQPLDPEATTINIYMSQANGEHMYRRTSVPSGTTSYVLGFKRKLRGLRMQFCDRIPASPLLAVHNGRLFSASDENVYFSEPMAYAHSHTSHGFLRETSDVNMLVAGEQGVYVGTEEGVAFYRGEDPKDFVRSTVSGPAIPGGYLALDGGFIDAGMQGRDVVLWWTTEGAMIAGMPDGSHETLRDNEFRIPDAEVGTMAQVTREGVKQVVSVMRNPKPDAALAFEDDVSIQVHRNGVTL